MTPLERFFNKVSINENGCWIWKGAKSSPGYGSFHYICNGKKHTRAHRVSWLLFIGEIPDGLNVLHKCDVISCVNPMHLFLGTQADNIMDCIQKGRPHVGYKLNKDQAMTIRNEPILGCRKLAKIYNVDRTVIMKIRRGEIWKSI